jgi:hypothetical protein
MLKTQVKPALKVCNFKISDDDKNLIKKNAEQYAEGNISEWIRFAAINYKPRKKDLAVPCHKDSK